MRSFAVAALLLGAAVATPVPQDYDWDAIEAADPVPTPDIPIVDADIQATTVTTYVSSEVAAAVSSAVLADPTDSTPERRSERRQTADTAANWLANTQWSTDALAAGTPANYNLIFQNQSGAAWGIPAYMGYITMKTYDVATCAANCNKMKGCSSINVYYERDPSVAPTDANPDPASKTVIKCVYYGAPIQANQATNIGQYSKGFHVVIGGSNAYTTTLMTVPSGYTATFVNNASVNAPLDCAGKDTYMGFKLWNDGVYDLARCGAACGAQSAYNIAYPPKTGSPQTCQFAVSYLMTNQTTKASIGQFCALYSETWPKSFAIRDKSYDVYGNLFTIGSSYMLSNQTNPGKPSGCTNPTKPTN